MNIPTQYPGLPNQKLYTGQKVEAAHIQSILDWLRWYIVYFNPSFTSFFSWGGQFTEGSETSITQQIDCSYFKRCSFQGNSFCFLLGNFPDYAFYPTASFYNGTTVYTNRRISRESPNLLVPPIRDSGSYFRLLMGPGLEGFYDLWQQAYIPE